MTNGIKSTDPVKQLVDKLVTSVAAENDNVYITVSIIL